MAPNLLAASQSYNLSGPGITPSGNGASQLEKIISTAIGLLTLVAVIFFVIQIILAGYGYMSAQGDKNKVEVARKRITDNILGLTIVIVAFGAGALIANIAGLGNIFNLSSILSILNP
jgi:hypothetical protein